MNSICTSTAVRNRALLGLAVAVVVTAVAGLALVAAPAAASTAAGTGGMVFVLKPKITGVDCRTRCGNARASRVAVPARVGSVVRVRGVNLRNVRHVVFLGRRGSRDDVRVPARRVTNRRLQVRVPKRAASGKIRLVDDAGVRSAASRVTILIAAPDPEESAATGGEELAPTPGTMSAQPFTWPVKGMLTSPFGPRWGRLHAGIDVALPAGQPIRAAADGVVNFRGWASGYGNYTCLTHRFAAPIQGSDSWSTCYAHQSRYETTRGAFVRQGTIIGRVGCTGSCTGDHLHFEIREGDQEWGTPHDPMPFLPRQAAKSALRPPMDFLPNIGAN